MASEPPNPAHLRLKAATAVVTVALTAGLLLFDWDSATGGHQTVFSGVRPAVKAALSRYVYSKDEQPAPGDGQAGGSGARGP